MADRVGCGSHVVDPVVVLGEAVLELLKVIWERGQATVREGVTAAVLTSWFPAALGEAVPDLLRKTRLAEEISGYEPAWGEDWVSARPPTSAEAREFSIKRGSPVVVVHSRRFDAEDVVLEYSELVARTDTRVEYRYTFRS